MNLNLIKIALIIILVLSSVCLQAQTITVDNYYNQETKKDKTGNTISFHYLWDDKESTGFSIFGEAFKRNGAERLKTLSVAPTAANLKGTDVFIIVDPDNLKDNPKPNYMTAADATVIAKWVKAGGILFLMGNDQVNCDLAYFNVLANKFGFNFNKDLILHVTDDAHFDDGGLTTAGSKLFGTAKQIFIKDASSINITGKATSVLQTKDGKNAIVKSTYGKGVVLAIGDPWLYNEYVNGRLPAKFENDKAANDIADWLIKHVSKK